MSFLESDPRILDRQVIGAGGLTVDVRRTSNMAVNHADGMLFASVVLYPVAAGYGAFGAGARWTTPLFVVAGLAIGVLTVLVSRFVLYSLMGRVFNLRMMQDENGWPAWIIGGPLMLVYFVYPMAIAYLGIYFAWRGSILVARALGYQ